MSQSPIELFTLLRDFPIITNGAALSPTTLDLDVPRFKSGLVHCVGLFIIGYVSECASTDIECNIGFRSGIDRNHEQAGFTNVSTVNFDSAAPGGVRSAEYTTLVNFLLEGRLQAWWQNKATINGAKTGRFTAILGMHRMMM